MTRKDYVLIAAALKAALIDVGRDVPCQFNNGVGCAATELADRLARDNPRFDRERFLKAAGVQP